MCLQKCGNVGRALFVSPRQLGWEKAGRLERRQKAQWGPQGGTKEFWRFQEMGVGLWAQTGEHGRLKLGEILTQDTGTIDPTPPRPEN